MFHKLFNPGESTCLTVDPHGTTIRYIQDVDPSFHQYFSINPISYTEDRDPTKEWHHPSVPRRCDANVTAYRNILIEMDKMPLDQQLPYVTEIGLPFTTATFSGSKSIHFIISLATDLATESEYKDLVKRVYRAVGSRLVDQMCKNPSRLSRVPGHVRSNTGKMQELLIAGERVANSVLEDWLLSRGIQPIIYENITYLPPRPRDFSSLKGDTQRLLMEGTAKGRVHNDLKYAAVDMIRCGFEPEEVLQKLNALTLVLGLNETKRISGFIEWALRKGEQNGKS